MKCFLSTVYLYFSNLDGMGLLTCRIIRIRDHRIIKIDGNFSNGMLYKQANMMGIEEIKNIIF